MSVMSISVETIAVNDRFDLRPIRGADVGRLEHYTSDERVARMTPTIPHPLPPGAAEAYVARVTAEDRLEDVWALDATKSGGDELVGVISLDRIDTDQAEIRYWIAPVYWNTGHASDAVRVLVEANPMGHATIFASVFQDNPASARVLTNCGFEYIGDAEEFCVARNAKLATWTYLKKMS
ncbi:MAG: GNAT family N-acetyltransferase [Pelagimonas sp.]|jgi:RimJ/RimL family protein N-acetyltransferase|nr:GNAT family N-acetyltransferase [Pelagimonas sp.]